MQTKIESAIETTFDLTIGFVIATALVYYAGPFFDLSNANAKNSILWVAMFTAVSFIRRFITRRIFNHLTHRRNNMGTERHVSIGHKAMVQTLCKSGAVMLNEMTPNRMTRLHEASKLQCEAGELMDAVAQECYYNKLLDVINIVEELGDMEFYMEVIRSDLLITREQTLHSNMLKLEKRYGKDFEYSDSSAIARRDKK